VCNLDKFQGTPLRLPKPLSDQFLVRVCSCPLCIRNRLCVCVFVRACVCVCLCVGVAVWHVGWQLGSSLGEEDAS